MSELPAILGGPKAVTIDGTEANRWPLLTEEDEAAVVQVLRDGELSHHPVTQRLEADYREFAGMEFCLAHANGTGALLAAFFAIGLQPGDEVIVPSATYWSSAIPMLWLGAIPKFCETEPQRLGLDPADVERKITPRTKAIVVVHLFGIPSKMTELIAIAKKHDLKIIEDASHAHGAVWRGRKCGSLGDISVFSLQGAKLAPAGEGGIFLTNDREYLERATYLGDSVRTFQLEGPNRRFAGTTFGIKTRIAPLSAAVARVQLKHLPERNARRSENVISLSEKLEKLGFNTFLAPPHVKRVYFEYLIEFDAEQHGLTMEQMIAALRAEGCDASHPRYPLLHQQPFFTEGHFAGVARLPKEQLPTYDPCDLPRTIAGNARLLKLPSFPSATRELLDQYADAFTKVLGNAAAIRDTVSATQS